MREFVGFSGDGADALEEYGGRSVIASPDGERFFVVTQRGDLVRDARSATLSVFRVRTVLAALASDTTATAECRVEVSSLWSDAEHEPIRDAFWSGREVVSFIGTQDREEPRVYRLESSMCRSSALTDAAHSVQFDFNNIRLFNDTAVYTAVDRHEQPEKLTSWPKYPGESVDGDTLSQVLIDDVRRDYAPASLPQVFVAHHGDAKPVLTLTRGSLTLGTWLSPDGKFAIVAVAPVEWSSPASWGRYQRHSTGALYRFVLIDVENSTAIPVFDAPVGPDAVVVDDVRAIWRADSRSVVLVNTALPLDGSMDPVREKTSYLIDYAPRDKSYSIVGSVRSAARISTARWIDVERSLELTYRKDDGSGELRSVFSKRGGLWREETARPATLIAPKRTDHLAGRLSVRVRQSASDPPRLLAERGSRTTDLLGADPALEGLWIAPVQPVQWSEPGTGIAISGGLLLPRQRGATPPPLVIQLYYYLPDRFTPDGVFPTAYAAQALVAQGMAVLFMDMPAGANVPGVSKPYMAHWQSNVPLERKIVSDNIDAAVDMLASKGLINRDEVGLVGFSRGGFLTHYLVTHPARTPIQAAVVDDSYTGSYGEYVIDAAVAANAARALFFSQATNLDYGHGIFWENKQAWLDESPLFNVERSRTPTLFTMHSADKSVYALETIGAWRMNRKPFDYFFLRDASHLVYRPHEHYALMNATVEWMRFWLQGVPPADAGRRARWEKVKADWAQAKSAADAHPSASRGSGP